MIAAENGQASVFVARAMTEDVILAFQIECLNHAGMGNLAQCQDRAQIRHRIDFGNQKLPAGVDLGG